MSAPEARAWLARWRLVEAQETSELRTTPTTVKAAQTAVLMAWARSVPRSAEEDREEAAVRARWRRLRERTPAARPV